jgi:uncharacterized protein (TIGR02145 family)
MRKTNSLLSVIGAALMLTLWGCGGKGVTDYVEINGVKWATCNVGEKGTFVANPEYFGENYTWEKAQTVCPSGWHAPTVEEFNSLLDTEKVTNEWIIQNDVTGRKFTDIATGKSIFLPACRKGREGAYWSTTQSPYAATIGCSLQFDGKSNKGEIRHSDKPCDFAVRCVKE